MPNTGPTLLVVEDDRALSGMLAELFIGEGYRVDTAHDGQQGMHRGLTGDYDALIVDRGLPVMDGAELVALLRSRGVTTPALILTARGAVEDRVEGLDAGAQDYLVKPFEIPELLARVRALVRRADNTAVVNAGGLALDRVTRRVSGATPEEVDVELSEREAALRNSIRTKKLLGYTFCGVGAALVATSMSVGGRPSQSPAPSPGAGVFHQAMIWSASRRVASLARGSRSASREASVKTRPGSPRACQ